MSNWTANAIPDLSDKVVIVTGANSGLGYESVLALARKKAHVIMACRDSVKGEVAKLNVQKAVPTAKLEVMSLNLSDLASVRQFVTDFKAKHKQLDILLNNAGIMAPPRAETKDGFEAQFGTNHLGHFALTGLLLDVLLKTPKNRIVTVSSVAARTGTINFSDLQSKRNYQPWLAYGQSKLANQLFMRELHRRLSETGAGSLSVAAHPGYASTNLQTANAGAFGTVFMQFSNTVLAQSAAMGALPQLYAATAPDVKGGEYFGPRFLMRGHPQREALRPKALDTATAKRLWEVSEELTGVRYKFSGTKIAV
jgi:protochlorophyllide reductase